ncbi:hypothetical protein F2P81_015726 [Scophthalmus maximus]|uniref:Uncharacterized protein n=1 Tax=Scophthalmus maximus TaxID=52904 RepID=A0A6A4SJ66_SCOMX|nr:hypothetical protein F2P81_015726 [Scophthalmus maximus]
MITISPFFGERQEFCSASIISQENLSVVWTNEKAELRMGNLPRITLGPSQPLAAAVTPSTSECQRTRVTRLHAGLPRSLPSTRPPHRRLTSG